MPHRRRTIGTPSASNATGAADDAGHSSGAGATGTTGTTRIRSLADRRPGGARQGGGAGLTRLAVWAPFGGRLQAEVVAPGPQQVVELVPDARRGWWTGDIDGGHGTRYVLRVDDGDPTPDPRSVWLPEGVHGPTAVYDHERFAWTDGGWAGRALEGGVVYELHVGTFTLTGTFDAVVDRLDHLLTLGVTHVELMPVAAWDGPHGWGYDGAALWAVHEAYGGPDGLKRLVDACHARGLAVLLDVVYNHLGPSGNYLSRFGPYFHDAYHTPWGQAVNLDGSGSDEVRAYLVENGLSWLRDFHLDGLRLDAVHALHDERAVHVLEGLSAAVDDLARDLRRSLVLVAESDRNDPRVATPRSRGGLGVDAQWNDDFHHALHALLTGEDQGYYADFAADPWAAVARTLTGAYFHDGCWSSFRRRSHGRPVDVDQLAGWRFLGYLQTHDQVGNRATGDRISATVSAGRLACGAALVLASPFTPMLFMGEEWGATTPWQFFTSYPDRELGQAVSDGRRLEFGEHGWGAAELPDPQEQATFERSRLDWSEPARSPHAELLAWYRDLNRLRREVPDLADPWLGEVEVAYDADAGWLVVHRGKHRVVVNLAAGEQLVPLDASVTEVLLAWAGGTVVEEDAVRMAGECAAVVAVAPTDGGSEDPSR